jgi:subtilase family serine protease
LYSVGCQPFDQRVALFLVLLVVLEELGSSREPEEEEVELALEVAAAMAPEAEVTVGFIPKLAIPVASNVL